jgi:TRAP-type C4-dicarboxylate transport system permease small subunit
VLKFPVIWLQFPILVFFVLATIYLLGHVISDFRAFGRRGGS